MNDRPSSPHPLPSPRARETKIPPSLCLWRPDHALPGTGSTRLRRFFLFMKGRLDPAYAGRGGDASPSNCTPLLFSWCWCVHPMKAGAADNKDTATRADRPHLVPAFVSRLSRSSRSFSPLLTPILSSPLWSLPSSSLDLRRAPISSCRRVASKPGLPGLPAPLSSPPRFG